MPSADSIGSSGLFPTRPIPVSRLIANFLSTAAILFMVAGIAFALGDAATHWQYANDGPQGTQIYRVGASGIEWVFGPPEPHPRGGPNGDADSVGLDFLGLMWAHDTLEWRNAGVRWRNTRLGFPWWALVVPFLARPLFRGLCQYDRRRIAEDERRRTEKLKGRKQTHCDVCGYDLRATPDRCPECGTIPRDGTSRQVQV